MAASPDDDEESRHLIASEEEEASHGSPRRIAAGAALFAIVLVVGFAGRRSYGGVTSPSSPAPDLLITSGEAYMSKTSVAVDVHPIFDEYRRQHAQEIAEIHAQDKNYVQAHGHIYAEMPRVLVTEGESVGDLFEHYTLDDCKTFCSETPGCLSFAFSGGVNGICHLKDMCVTPSSPMLPVGTPGKDEFKTYYKKECRSAQVEWQEMQTYPKTCDSSGECAIWKTEECTADVKDCTCRNAHPKGSSGKMCTRKRKVQCSCWASGWPSGNCCSFCKKEYHHDAEDKANVTECFPRGCSGMCGESSGCSCFTHNEDRERYSFS